MLGVSDVVGAENLLAGVALQGEEVWERGEAAGRAPRGQRCPPAARGPPRLPEGTALTLGQAGAAPLFPQLPARKQKGCRLQATSSETPAVPPQNTPPPPQVREYHPETIPTSPGAAGLKPEPSDALASTTGFTHPG